MPTILPCPACRTGVLARRGDPLCLTCVKASREMPPRPLWLFDSPLLRQALAEVNLAAVPAIVRAACGLSQRDLAAIVGWSGAALSYYERGRRDGMFDVRTVFLFADAVGMPRAALLPLVLADPDAGLALGARDGTGTGAGRRGWGGVAATLPAARDLRGVSVSHVRYWRACTDALYVRDGAVGGTVLLAPALQQWRRVRLALAEGGSDEAGGQPFAAAGELALCAGFIAVDAGRLPLARSLYAEARELADGAGDAVLAVRVLAGQSLLYAELAGTGQDSARQALRLAYQAQEEGRYIPMPGLHALIALRHAGAAALLGDKAAFQKAIIQARRELERGSRDEDLSPWLRFAGETEITAAEALGYLILGEASRSVLLYRQVLAAGPGTSGRDRASYGAGLACALLQQGARGDAVAAAMNVLPALESEVTSVRCLNQLRPVRQAAGGIAGADEFRERFDAIERALAVPYSLPSDDAPEARAAIPALSGETGIPQ